MTGEREEPMTQTMKAMEARNQWSKLLNRVYRRETRVVVEKSGVPVAALVSMDDLRRLQGLDSSRADDFKALEATRAAFKDIPDEELEREVNRAFREGRERYRARRPENRSARSR